MKNIKYKLGKLIMTKNFYNIESLLYILRQITFNWKREEREDINVENLITALSVISEYDQQSNKYIGNYS